MKTPIIVGNWKSNKTVGEAEKWVGELKEKTKVNGERWGKLEIVICPPFTLLYPFKLLVERSQLPIKLGAQDTSPFPDGAYTGEISGRMLRDLAVSYVLVGHSERRRYFAETDIQAVKKIRMSLDFDITPIICVSGVEQFTSILNKLEAKELGKIVFMYEPPEAISAQVGSIGQGQAEPVEEVVKTIKKMKKLTPASRFFYGGSVKSHNVADFLSQSEIEGVVPGTASQSAAEFAKIIQNAV